MSYRKSVGRTLYICHLWTQHSDLSDTNGALLSKCPWLMWIFWSCIIVCWHPLHRGRALGHKRFSFQTSCIQTDHVSLLSWVSALMEPWTCSLNLISTQFKADSKNQADSERLFTMITALSRMSSITANPTFSEDLLFFR